MLILIAALILLALPVGAFAAGVAGPRPLPQAALPQAGGPAGPSAPDAGTGPRLADVALYATPDGTGNSRKSFSASADNQINIRLRWLNLDAGVHDAYVTLTSPDGSVYQVLDVTFSTAPPTAKGPQSIQRPGVLHPIAVQAANTTPGGHVVWGQVPIAGTWMGRLPGAWQVSVRLDTNPRVLSTYPFTLNQ